MNKNEEKMLLAQITKQMEEILKEIHKLHNLIMTNEYYDIFEIVVRPLEFAFGEACKKLTALYDLSKGGK